MANIITVPPGPSNFDIIQGFLDRYNQNRQLDEQSSYRKQQLAQQATYQQGQLGIEQGNLDVNRGQLGLQQDSAKQAKLQQEAEGVVEEIGRMFDSNMRDQAAAKIQELKATRPDLMPFVGKVAARMIQTPTDTANQNAARFDATQTGLANTGTDPNAVNYTTRRNLKADMPPYAFAQQQATDLQSRGGGSTAAVPTPTGNAVTDFERRATEAMPTASQNQTAQTNKDVARIHEAGATGRQRMTIDAAAAGGDDMDTMTRELVDNPDAFYAWDAKKKRAFFAAGGRAPAKLGEFEKRREIAARNSIGILDDVSELLDKWDKRGLKINGPLLGRYNEATRAWGAAPLPRNMPKEMVPEYEGDIAKIQEWLGANKVGEVTAIVGGRANYQYLKELAPPVISQNHNYLKGSIDGMKQRMEETIETVGKARWGAKGAPKVKGIELDDATAMDLLKEAGGDKEKARALAKKRGYNF